MKFQKVIFVTGVLLLAGCARPLQIGLRTERERIPSPVFVAFSPDRENQREPFTDIKVYEVKDRCKTPDCPLAWHVVTNPKQSPTFITYAGSPSFGSLTLVGGSRLKPGLSYEMVLSEKTIEHEVIKGRYSFAVDMKGKVVGIEKKVEKPIRHVE